MAAIVIGNYVMKPEPRKVKISFADQDSAETGRNQGGYLYRDRVRGGATANRKISLETMPMTTEEISNLLQALGPASLLVTYLDPYVGANRTATFYVGDRPTAMYTLDEDGNAIWEPFTFDLVEF